MLLPKDIKGINKLRDADIINLYLEGYSYEEIKELRKLEIGVRRIEQVIYENRALVKIDRQWEETKQILRIKKHIKNNPASRKDVYDWESLLDSKITPKKVEHSGEIKGNQTIIVSIPMERKVDYDSRLSGSKL